MPTLEFQLLGTMMINGSPASDLLPGARGRQLLATLLQHANRFVAFGTIADNLWEGNPPRSAAANVRTHVGSVRRAIAAAGVSAEVQTRPGGYQILVQPDLLDTSRMQDLLVAARQLQESAEYEGALRSVDQALDLWRGVPFEDLPVCSAWLPQITRWEQVHAEALALAIGLHLDHGDPWQAAELVRRRLDADRYDESAWSLLVQCHLKGGMVSQAVQVLAEARQVLADELGADPGPELTVLESQIGDDPEVSGLTAVPAAPDQLTPHPIPAQLPHDLPDFTGRQQQIDEAMALCARRPEHRPAVLVVTGAPGVGKTVLVTHLAHRLRDWFPDGQIYLDLRGTTTPLSAPFAVAEALAAIGISNPSDEPDRAAALLRSELANRRLLLVVENAAAAEQLTPLIPGTGDSAVLITSRRRLADLPGALMFDLDLPDIAEAAELVGRVAGIEDSEQRALLAQACGRHPLAIRIVCGRLRHRPDTDVRSLAAQVSDAHPIEGRDHGRSAFRASAELSCSRLTPSAGRALRTLGALELGEFSGLTVEAATGCADEAGGLLAENLLLANQSASGPTTYQMHDMLRAHVRGWTTALGEDPAETVRPVLLSWLTASSRAARALPTTYFGPQPDLVEADLGPDWDDLIDDPSGGWFDAERQRLDGMVATAIRYGFTDLAWKTVVSWSPYFDLRGHTRAWYSALTKVLKPVRAAGDVRGLASVLRDLGQVMLYRDLADEATLALRESRGLFVSIGDWAGAGFASIGLAAADDNRGRVGAGTREHSQRALAWFEQAGHRPGIAVAHNAIALSYVAGGDFDRAERWLESALGVAREVDDRHRIGQILRRCADVRRGRSDCAGAQQCLQAALEIFLELGDHRCVGYASTGLGRLLLAGGDTSGANRQFREALAAGRRLADPAAQAAAWDGLADAMLHGRSEERAAQCLQRSIRAWQVADRPQQAAAASARLASLEPAQQ